MESIVYTRKGFLLGFGNQIGLRLKSWNFTGERAPWWKTFLKFVSDCKAVLFWTRNLILNRKALAEVFYDIGEPGCGSSEVEDPCALPVRNFSDP